MSLTPRTIQGIYGYKSAPADDLPARATQAAELDHLGMRPKTERLRQVKSCEELNELHKTTVSSAADIIEQAGYPLEQWSVITPDGYVLVMERMPRKGGDSSVHDTPFAPHLEAWPAWPLGRAGLSLVLECHGVACTMFIGPKHHWKQCLLVPSLLSCRNTGVDNTELEVLRCVAGARDTVLFMHGIPDTSIGWVANGVTGSQAFAAYDAGFDVWLGNSRANPPISHIGMPQCPCIGRQGSWACLA